MRLTRARFLSAVLCGVLCAVPLALAGGASAATVTYPGGGSGFDSGVEGWSGGDASCSPAELLCTSEAGYDSSAGNPAGSIAAKTTVTVNLIGLFKGTAKWTSPQFTVPVGAITDADLRLDRAFSPGGLVDVEPEATYDVILSDLTSGTSTTILSEELDEEDEAFAAAGAAPAAVLGGHTYRLQIAAETVQSALALSLLSGTANLRFDNVGLTVKSSGGEGGGSGNGGGSGGKRKRSGSASLSDQRLLALLRSEAPAAPAVLAGNGKRLLVKVHCPAKARRSCRITTQGLLAKRKPATAKRTVEVLAGKGKRVALSLKPKARGRIDGRKRLLVRESVHAGRARATVYEKRKLIRQ